MIDDLNRNESVPTGLGRGQQGNLQESGTFILSISPQEEHKAKTNIDASIAVAIDIPVIAVEVAVIDDIQ